MAMAKKGYDGASIGDIGKAARLTPGLIHYHFRDKLDVLAALASQLSKESTSTLRQHLATLSPGPAQALSAIIDFYLGLGTTAKPEVLACWIAFSGEALRHKSIKEAFEATLADIQHIIREQIEAGVREKVFDRKTEPEAVAAALVALIQGYFVLAGTARALIPKGSAARTAKQMLQGALGAKL